MNVLLEALGFRREARYTRDTISFADLERLGSEIGADSASGVRVSLERAFSVSAWWRGISIRASAPARIGPPRVLRKSSLGYEPDTTHPAHRVLKVFRGMTAFSFYRSRCVNRLTRGNGYAFVDRKGGRPVEMIPLDPDRVAPARENGVDFYVYAPADVAAGPRRLALEDVFHTQGISIDGRRGLSVVGAARDTLGSAIAMRGHGSALFRNFARLGVILEHPGVMSDAAKKNFVEGWDRGRAGVDNAFKTIMLEEGVKVASAPTTMTPDDAQLIEGRTFETREIANFVGVPSHWLNDPVTKTYASAEQDYQVFLDNTLDPDLHEMEEALELVLLTEEERLTESVLIRFDRTRLLGADAKSQAEAASKALAGVPWKTRDEVRGEMGLGPLPNGEGATVVIPINLQNAADADSPAAQEPTSTAKGAPAAPAPSEPPAADDAARAAVVAFAADARARMLRRLTAHARKASRTSATFGEWLASLPGEHEAVVRDALRPAAGVLDVDGLVAGLFEDVRAACDALFSATPAPADFAAAIDAAMTALEGRAVEPPTLPASAATEVDHVHVHNHFSIPRAAPPPAPVVHVAAPVVSLPAPVVQVKVDAPVVRVEPRIEIPALPAPIVVPQAPVAVSRGNRLVRFFRDKDGRVNAAELES